jgi:hypothetical protein
LSGAAKSTVRKVGRKKLRESAAKALKSLSGINFCAAFFRGGWLPSPRAERRTARASASTTEMSWRRHKPLHGSNSSTIPGSGPIDSPFSQPPARSRLGPTATSWSANQARLRWKFDDLFKVEGLRRGDGPGRRPQKHFPAFRNQRWAVSYVSD